MPKYHAQVFGAEQGIGAGGISDFFQDKQQFLWIVNLNTVQRFDGRNVRTYKFEHTVRQAMCDDTNRIWLISGRQIWRHGPAIEGFETVPFDTTGGVYALAVFQCPGGPLSVLTAKGLFVWSEAKKGFQFSGQMPPPPRGYTNLWRFTQRENTVFYVSADSLVAFNTVSGATRRLPFNREFAYMYALTPNLVALTDYQSQTFWFDFGNQTVKRIDPERYGLSAGQSIMGITGVAPMEHDLFLMTSRIGTLVYDLKTDRFSRERIYAGGKPLELEELFTRVNIDNNGTVWAHNTHNIIAAKSLGNGIGLLRNAYIDPPRAWSNRTSCLAGDNRGNLWMGGAGGFKKLNLKTGDVTFYPSVEGAKDRLSHASVRGMGYDGRYVVLGPTDKGVWFFDPKTQRYRRPVYADEKVRQSVENDFIDHLTVLRNGDILVAGRFHPYRIEARTYRMGYLTFPGDNTNTNVCFQDQTGRIWIGSHAGAYCLDSTYQLMATYPCDPVFCFLDGQEYGEILIGTDQGMLRISPDGQGPTHIPLPGGATAVTTLFRDSLQRIWMGTLDGLFLADPELSRFKAFDFADNLQGLVFNGNASVRAENGMVFFAGINGINYFFPENIPFEDRQLRVSIQSVRFNDHDSVALWQPTGNFRLPFRNNTLTVEVVAPYFNNAGKVQYRYRLEGADNTWVNNGVSNQIRLAHLPPGDYKLVVAATVSGNTWFETPAPLLFSILPPFWQTWPFRLLLTAVVIGLLFGVIRYRENRLKKQQQTRLELETLEKTNLRYQLETEQVINYFSRSLAAQSTVDEALWSVAEQCIAHLGWEDCVIYLFDEQRGVLVQKAAWGQKSSPNRTIVNPIEIRPGEGIVGAVAASGKPECVGDVSTDPRYILDDASRASELAVPILSGNQVMGVIDSEHSQRDFFTPWHVQILTAIASLCSNKIALAKVEEEKRHALLEAVENRRKAAEAKLQSMRMQMNPHFLFNALNSIQQMTMRGNGDGAAMYLSKFSKLLRMVLASGDHENIPLRDELSMLRLYLELESLRFDNTFRFELLCSDDIDPDEFKVPPLLIQPYVENAIWHGLMHKEGPRSLTIRFDAAADDRLRCTIEDNGIGRAAAKAHARNGKHAGKAVHIGNERIQTLNQQFGQNNRIDFEDLYDRQGNAAGTRVTLELD